MQFAHDVTLWYARDLFAGAIFHRSTRDASSQRTPYTADTRISARRWFAPTRLKFCRSLLFSCACFSWWRGYLTEERTWTARQLCATKGYKARQVSYCVMNALDFRTRTKCNYICMHILEHILQSCRCWCCYQWSIMPYIHFANIIMMMMARLEWCIHLGTTVYCNSTQGSSMCHTKSLSTCTLGDDNVLQLQQ